MKDLLKKQVASPMGPVLYLDTDLPGTNVIKHLKKLSKFVKERNNIMNKDDKVYFSDVVDVHALAESILDYCERLKNEEDQFEDEVADCVNADELYVVFPKTKWIEDLDMKFEPINYVGPYSLITPSAVREDVYKIIQNLKKTNRRIRHALAKKDPYRVLEKAAYDLYAFKNFDAHIIPYLSEIVKRKIFSAKDLYDKKKAVDPELIRENYELIQRYIPYFVLGNGGNAKEVKQALKDTGFYKKYKPPYGVSSITKHSLPSLQTPKSASPDKKLKSV